jgi:hypothetical protein
MYEESFRSGELYFQLNRLVTSRGVPGGGSQWACPPGSCLTSPPIQEITEHAVTTLHLQSSVQAAGWLITVPDGLTPAATRPDSAASHSNDARLPGTPAQSRLGQPRRLKEGRRPVQVKRAER